MKTLFILLLVCLFGNVSWAQVKNTSSEVMDYREMDGKIILRLLVNGEEADFLLDLGGVNAVLPEYVEKLKLTKAEKTPALQKFLLKDVPVTGFMVAESVTCGNGAFGNNFSFLVLGDEPYLRELEVAGIINGKLFSNLVFTLDSRRKKITLSSPYRPSYMKLTNRVDLNLEPFGCILNVPIRVNGKEISAVLDTWYNGMLMLPAEHFKEVKGVTTSSTCPRGYAKKQEACTAKGQVTLALAKKACTGITVCEGDVLRPTLGTAILKEGLVSVDAWKGKIYFQDFDEVPIVDEIEREIIKMEPGKLTAINREFFLEHIYDYRKDKQFAFKGNKPIVIDFWATWCGPCMQMVPQMEQLAEKYKDQVTFFKVNADKEKELCNIFKITALPTFLFITADGTLLMEVGADAAKVENIILGQLLKNSEGL